MLYRMDIMSLNVNIQYINKWKDLSDCTIMVYFEIILSVYCSVNHLEYT